MASLGSFVGHLGSGALYEMSPLLPFWSCAGISAVCGLVMLLSVAQPPRSTAVVGDLGDVFFDGEVAPLNVSLTTERLVRAGTRSNTFALPLPLLTLADPACNQDGQLVQKVNSDKMPVRKYTYIEEALL